MSTTAIATTAPTSAELTKLQQTFEKIDAFTKENALTTILGNEADMGSFSVSLKLANALATLREMLTPEVMKPIMALQGSALGFRTDKDKEGGYTLDVVKEAVIEATMKGFRPTGNEMNIIGGRFYAARDGFERIFRDLGKSGRVTNLRLTPSIPKTTTDGAVVAYAASWDFKRADGQIVADELKIDIPVRVNNGQGPDAVLGKAKRKMLAAIYSRITGTTITDGDVDDPKTIEAQATPVHTQTAPAALPAEVLADLEKILKPHEEKANAYLAANGYIKTGQTFREMTDAKFAQRIIKQTGGFLAAIGVKAGG